MIMKKIERNSTTNANNNNNLKKVVCKEIKRVSDGNLKLVRRLHEEFSKLTPGNFAYSPFGIGAFMLSLKFATTDETSLEIQKSMKFPKDDGQLHMGYSMALNSIKTKVCTRINTKTRLDLSTRFFLKEDYFHVRKLFTSIMKDYGTSTEKVNFANIPETLEKMNKWLDEASVGQINSSIKEDIFKKFASARILVFNSFILNAPWDQKFHPFLNDLMKFQVAEGNTVNVVGMRSMSKYFFIDLIEYDSLAVVVPFRDQRFKMLFVVPKQGIELEKVEKDLASMIPAEFFARMKLIWMILQMPKFRIESTLPMKKVLNEMGITKAFEKSSNYEGMIEMRSHLWTNEIFHKICLDVREEGIGTGVGLPKFSKPRVSSSIPMITFRIDRPFYYQIIDQETNFVLLAGRCNNPTENS